jgi:hypothetical protein
MSDIPSSSNRIQIEATQSRAPVSEALMQTIGGTINSLIDGLNAANASISSVSASAATITAINTYATYGNGTVYTTPAGQCAILGIYTSGLDSGNIQVRMPGGSVADQGVDSAVYDPGSSTYWANHTENYVLSATGNHDYQMVILPAGWSLFLNSGIGHIKIRLAGITITNVH